MHVLAALLNGKWTVSYVTSRYTVLRSPSILCRSRVGRAETSVLSSVTFKKKKCLLRDCWGTLKILEFVEAKRHLLLSTFFALYSVQGFILFIAVLFFFSHGPRSVKPMPITTTTITTSTPMSLATS